MSNGRLLVGFSRLIKARVCSFKGFMQVYQLQTENDEEETWRDLVRIAMPFVDTMWSN